MAKRKMSTFERLPRGELSRKRGKQLEQQMAKQDASLQIVPPDAAGIDVGNDSHFVSVGPARDRQWVREFGSWTGDLRRMVEWLQSGGIKTVVMRSTGYYWMAWQEVLEKADMKVSVVNARGTKNLPGRKSDVQECEWLRRLHSYGLLRNSYQPPEQIRSLRTVWRRRETVVKEAGRAVQWMHKVLTTMNVRLGNVISDLSGSTGMTIVREILKGERDPRKLAQRRDRRVKASEQEIVLSLEGNWQEDALFELQQVVDGYEFWQKQLEPCDRKLKQYLEALPERARDEEKPADREAEAREDPRARRRRRIKANKKQKNQPAFDLGAEQRRTMGVDLCRIDGIGDMTVQTILSEIGPDLSAWPSEKHFTAWLGLAPRRDIRGGKLIRHVVVPGKQRVANALRMAAQALKDSDSYLGARYRFLKVRLEGARATKAMARYLACLVYRMMTKGQTWVDRGNEYFETKRRERDIKTLHRKAAALGATVVFQA